MEKGKYVVGIGEVLWDVLPAGKQIGGAPANFVYHVTRMGCRGMLISAAGMDDKDGDEICTELGKRGIDSIIERIAYPTGRVLVSLDNEGIPTYDIVRNVAWDNITYTPQLASVAKETAAVCFGSLAQRSSVSRKTIMEFVDAVPDTPSTYKIFDVNLRQNFYDRDVIISSVKRCNILKINEEELQIITGLFGYAQPASREMVCRKIVDDFSLKYLILTLGAEGSALYTPDKVYLKASPKVKVADTVGAGDSFTAAFVASLLKGADVESAHSAATRTAAYVCTCKGAMPEMPSLA